MKLNYERDILHLRASLIYYFDVGLVSRLIEEHRQSDKKRPNDLKIVDQSELPSATPLSHPFSQR